MYCAQCIGANKQRWLPLNFDPTPARPPPSKGSHRGDRHRDHDRVHRDRIDRGGERGDRVGDGGHREHKDGHIHKERDGYRDHYRGDRGYQSHYYNRYGGHDRDKDREGREQDRGYRRGGDRYNLPPRYANQPQGQDFVGVESGSGGSYNSGMFDGSNRGYGGRGSRGGRGRNWRYPSPITAHSKLIYIMGL